VFVVLGMLSGCTRPGDPDSARGAAAAMLAGTVLYRERIALPPDAAVHVRLEDVTIADAPATTLAEQTTAAEGRQVPIPFALRYSADDIDENRRYGVRAEIRDASGRLLFVTAAHHGVLTNGGPSDDVIIVLARASSSAQADDSEAAADALAGTAWRLVEFQDEQGAAEPVDPDALYTIEFAADGNLAGQAHCNRYFGRYGFDANGLSISGVGATLAMCAPPSRATEFLGAVERATQSELRGENLRLLFGNGGVLTFVRTPAAASASVAPASGRTFVFDCSDDVSFTIRTGPGEVALWTPEALGDQYLVLAETPVASGARYQEGETVYWNRGDSALFEVAGQRFTECRANPAKVPWADAARRGVTFRAIGNEPSWHLEVEPGQSLLMVTNLGADAFYMPYSEPEIEGVRTTYRAETDEHTLTAIVQRVPCTDSMSGDPHEATVTATFDGETFRGCGRFL
jgi:putative lipoprotein